MRGLIVLLGLLLLAPVTSASGERARTDHVGSDVAAIVVRDETHLTLDASGRVRETVQREVTILTPAGRDRFATLVLGYDTFRRVRRLHGAVHDGEGRTVRTLRQRDVEDHPATASFSLYDDSRVRVAQLQHDTYPYRVVWSYEIDHDGLLNWPTWRPQPGGEPVLMASLTVDVPAGTAFRFLPERLSLEPVVTDNGGTRRYEWRGAFSGRTIEPLGPARIDQGPLLHLATDVFVMANYAGSLATWAGLAQWYGDLSAGRAELPNDAREAVARLVADTDDPLERARRIYTYLQRRTRYVSVQLGIGGWQTFPATYVHERRYGDCKALVNYLYALLREAGIRSYPALIGHGRPDLDPDFPRNAFNHVVLYVPLESGDVWLEATSQTAPFGYLGAGSEDRWVLVVEEAGGHLRRTPPMSAATNPQVRSLEARISLGGALTDVREEVTFGGHQLMRVRDALFARSPAEREGWWRERSGLRQEALVADFAGIEDERGVAVLSYTVPRYASSVGSRMFVRPNVAERWAGVPPAVSERTHEVRLGYPFHDVDRVRLTVPPGYSVEALPEPVHVETPFGRYVAAVVLEGETLVYERELELRATVLPPEAYEDYRRFVEAVVRADDAQVVLRR